MIKDTNGYLNMQRFFNRKFPYKPKGPISDCLWLRNIFKTPSAIKTNTCESQNVNFFLKKSHEFDRKTGFHQISLSNVFSLWKNFPKELSYTVFLYQ